MIEYSEQEVVSTSQLKLISELANAQLDVERKIEDAENYLKKLQLDLKRISEKDLPEAMLEAGCKSYTLTNGQQIEIKGGLTASIPNTRKEEVCNWLRSNGYGDIVSEDVEVKFGRGQENLAHELVKKLQEEGYVPTCRTDVNTSRLKSLISEQLEKGIEMPLEFLGAYTWKKAIVK